MTSDEEARSVMVEVTTQTPPNCPACGEAGILSAEVPHTITNARGEQTTGSAVAVLCETCDIDDPAAGPLITYFAVHGAVGADTVEQGTALLATWLSSAEAKGFSLDALELENEAWLKGELNSDRRRP